MQTLILRVTDLTACLEIQFRHYEQGLALKSIKSDEIK